MTLKEAKELWIGDEVYLIKSKRKGIFTGINSDKKIIVKIGEKIIKSSISNVSRHIEVADDWKKEIDMSLYTPPPSLKNIKNSPTPYQRVDVIDLHLEKLSPNLAFSNTQRALDFQIEKCKAFIDEAIDSKRLSITIIHGKGEGILKTHIHALLQNYREVNFHSLVNKGGATEVLFQH
jgi:dsDNA-specific endonuclease/ATPase MutS2